MMLGWKRAGAALVFTMSALVLTSGAATADEPADDLAGGLRACNADAKKHCADVKPGGLRVVECLSRKQASLSPACKPLIEPGAESTIAWREACGADIDKECPQAVIGTGLVHCLSSKRASLSPTCRKKVDDSLAITTLVCAAQVGSLCKGVKSGDGRWLQCIDDNEKKLTPPCSNYWAYYDAVFKASCAADRNKHCKGKTRYDELYPCLQAKQSELSTNCAKFVSAK